jgi:uncharacterized cupin superfamily protein
MTVAKKKVPSRSAKTVTPAPVQVASAQSATADRTRVNGEGFFEPFNIDDVPWQHADDAFDFKRLGAYGGGSQVGVGIDVLKPGQFSNRFHYHLHEEEHVFILKGSATLILGNGKYVMNERDFCTFPAGQRAGHHLFNHTRVNCVFMTIGNQRAEDICCFPDTGNARCRASGKMVPIEDALSLKAQALKK